jgi:hypothetical protein
VLVALLDSQQQPWRAERSGRLEPPSGGVGETELRFLLTATSIYQGIDKRAGGWLQFASPGGEVEAPQSRDQIFFLNKSPCSFSGLVSL